MASMNKVILMGNLTRDPELKDLPSGTAVCNMGLALNENYTDRNGKKVEKTCFVDIVVWERQAQTCAQYLRKGSPVLIEGRLEMSEWKTKEGETRSKLKVRADRVQFISSGRRDEGGGERQPQPPLDERKPIDRSQTPEDDLHYGSDPEAPGEGKPAHGEDPF